MTQHHLPQFTILHGSPYECNLFAEELHRRSVLSIMLNFESSILDSMVPMFFADNHLEADLDNPASQLRYLPNFPTIRVADWIAHQKILLRQILGEDAIGKLFIHDYLTQGFEDYAPYAIVSNCDSALDIKPIIEKFGYGSTAVVNLGPLTNTFVVPHARCYWIAVSEPTKQVDQYLHDRRAEVEHART